MRRLCEFVVYGVVEALLVLVIYISSEFWEAYRASECRVRLARPSSNKINRECLRRCETSAEQERYSRDHAARCGGVCAVGGKRVIEGVW
jgi:hypothetical protein